MPAASVTNRPKLPPDDLAALQFRFGAIVKSYRMGLGLSQEELAWRAGIHRTYLADIERGGRNISLARIVQLVHALGVTLPSFFESLDQTSHLTHAQAASARTGGAAARNRTGHNKTPRAPSALRRPVR